MNHTAAFYKEDQIQGVISQNISRLAAPNIIPFSDFKILPDVEPYNLKYFAVLLEGAYKIIELGAWFIVFILYMLAVFVVYKVFWLVWLFNFSLVGRFRRAMRNGELRIAYQPIVDIKTGLWHGAEAFLRWDKKGGVISSDLFLPMIERFGLMPLTTRWICKRVVEDYSSFMWATQDFFITINLSVEYGLDPTFPEFMQELLAEHQIPASRFVFEVSECESLNKAESIIQLNLLRAQGHKIALEEFGTGHSSLSYFEFMPLDILKIDSSFLMGKESIRGNIILSNILNLANSLKLLVVVEGVERRAHVDRLLLLGVKLSQGWFYSDDLSADQLVRGYFSLKRPDKDHPI
ncbi:EAL domain-containing protein [Pseudomonas fluorescens]|uniref:EAL domain-containing protein n=1 Tax=Pseudomonas fluorescens TaxID=294 RepID=UPI000CCFE3BD|nr:EAL domain-containing protein [Pseudomonas fluorescens]PNY78770.1 hypothetical protein C1751_01685 [Pseudomonas fluorescens]